MAQNKWLSVEVETMRVNLDDEYCIDIKKKMPILGDIPLIALLFQNSEKILTKSDLIIFITPHIITLDMDQDS